jgi:hypothetical protein
VNIKPRHKIFQVTAEINRVGNGRLKSLDLAFVPYGKATLAVWTHL